MNQETINVILFALDDDNDILRFSIDGKNLDINLNKSDCQNAMKNMFSVLLKKAVNTDLSLEFSANPGYTRGMYIEVCEEYVKDLNRELSEVVERIRNELKNKN